jgi:hypothetical protein
MWVAVAVAQEELVERLHLLQAQLYMETVGLDCIQA